VTGVAAQSQLDHKTGYRDAGYGLDIVDWIMEPGSDLAYRNQLKSELVYEFNNLVHGKTAKRSIEGPQICTRAGRLDPHVIAGKDFIAVTQEFRYKTAAPEHKTGSLRRQIPVFPKGKRYFVSSDRITTVNDGDALFFRIDMHGHIKHNQGDTFSEVYLSYVGIIPSRALIHDFAHDGISMIFAARVSNRGASSAPIICAIRRRVSLVPGWPG
jgi:hypothetical protein